LYALPRYLTHKKAAAGLGPTAGSLPTSINEFRNFEGGEEFQVLRPFSPSCDGQFRSWQSPSNSRREPAFTDIMSDAFDYFRAYAVRALCKARSMPRGKMKHLQLVAGRIYNLLKKEAAYGPNVQHLEDFRAAQKLESSLDRGPSDRSGGRLAPAAPQSSDREAG
jgi:hypothetical protein